MKERSKFNSNHLLKLRAYDFLWDVSTCQRHRTVIKEIKGPAALQIHIYVTKGAILRHYSCVDMTLKKVIKVKELAT